MASRSRRESGRGGVHTEVFCLDEGTTAVEFKPEGVDNVEDKIVEIFFLQNI
jgi:hypothetical protein